MVFGAFDWGEWFEAGLRGGLIGGGIGLVIHLIAKATGAGSKGGGERDRDAREE